MVDSDDWGIQYEITSLDLWQRVRETRWTCQKKIPWSDPHSGSNEILRILITAIFEVNFWEKEREENRADAIVRMHSKRPSHYLTCTGNQLTMQPTNHYWSTVAWSSFEQTFQTFINNIIPSIQPHNRIKIQLL